MTTEGNDQEAMLLRLALDAAGLGAWTTDLGLQTLTWDARTRDLLGHGGSDPDYDDSFLKHVHPDDRTWVDAAIKQALSNHSMLDIEYRIVRPDDGRITWIHAHGAMMTNQGREWMAGTVQDVTARHQAEDLQKLLSGEIEHRMKNMLSVVLAIISQTAARYDDPKVACEMVANRVQALAGATDLLTRQHADTDMMDLALAATRPVAGGGVEITGPLMTLCADSVIPLSLILHELSTNSVKHGALSVESGRVTLRWEMQGEGDRRIIAIEWTESGGPPVQIPKRRGFGTRLIETAFRHVIGTTSTIEHLPQGVRWSMRTPASGILL